MYAYVKRNVRNFSVGTQHKPNVFISRLTKKIFFATMERMSKAKELVPIAKLDLLVESLRKIANIVEQTAKDCANAELDGVKTDGWRMVTKGVQHLIEQTQKIVGPANRIHTMSAAPLALPGQTVPATRKQRETKPKDNKSVISPEKRETTKTDRSAKTKP